MKLRINKPSWDISPSPVNYNVSVNKMEDFVNNIKKGELTDSIIMLVENFDVYTKGTAAKNTDLLYNNGVPIIDTKRGGKFTYHGLGQRIVYPIIDLSLCKDITLYINNLQNWIIDTLYVFGIKGYLRDGLIGVWVKKPNSSQWFKIAALGIRLSRWVAYHGIAINIKPNLTNYNAIIPCGIKEDGVTSLKDLGVDISLEDFDTELKTKFSNYFEY